MALVVDADIPAQTVQETISASRWRFVAAGGHCSTCIRANRFQPAKKSLAYALTFQAEDRSLTEDEVRSIYQRIQQHATATLGAELRR